MTVKNVMKLEGTTADVMNAIRTNSTFDYQERVPVATQQNFKDVSQAILSSTATMNNFLNQLVNRIGLVMITSKMYTNPLKPFKKGMLEYGETVEEVFVNISKAELFDYNDEKNPFKRKNPDVRSAFHKLNNEKQYQTTVSETMLSTALLTEQGVMDLVGKIVESLYTSFEYDEFNEMKLLLVEQAKKEVIKPIVIPSLENANEVAKVIKEYSNRLRFMNDSFNYTGVMTHTPVTDQYLIMTSKFSAMMDVDVLAKAFNMNKTQFMGNQVIIDDFLDLEGVEAMLVDKQFLMIFDNLIRTTEQYNPARLYWNYFLTTRQTFSISPFANAIMFTTKLPVPDLDLGELCVVPWEAQDELWGSGEISLTELTAREGSIPLKLDLKTGEWLEGDLDFDMNYQEGVFYGVEVYVEGSISNHYENSNKTKTSPLTITIPKSDFIDKFPKDTVINMTPYTNQYHDNEFIKETKGTPVTFKIIDDVA